VPDLPLGDRRDDPGLRVKLRPVRLMRIKATYEVTTASSLERDMTRTLADAFERHASIRNKQSERWRPQAAKEAVIPFDCHVARTQRRIVRANFYQSSIRMISTTRQ
jgi:hypothetical protein